jgi:hypothetical protein
MNSNKLKTNYDLLEEQKKDFSNNGELLRNIFGLSVKHPFLSLIFVLSFGVLTNALFELFSILAYQSQYNLAALGSIISVLVIIQIIIFFTIKQLHSDLFVPIPINQKKVLITLMSPRSNFKETPSYGVYETLLYNPAGYAAINSLQKVIIITSESQESKNAADGLKTHIESSNRETIIKGIYINNRSLTDIQKQIELIFSELKKDHKPYEMIADYTGANKDMSIALLKVSEKELVLPVYFKDATFSNHSKYSQ